MREMREACTAGAKEGQDQSSSSCDLLEDSEI